MPAAIMGASNASFEAGAPSPTGTTGAAAHEHRLSSSNLEHLMAGVDLLLAILQAAPWVTLLVTTSCELNCQAEDCFLPHGLTTPRQVDLADATQTAAVRLGDRLRLTKEFKFTPETAATWCAFASW